MRQLPQKPLLEEGKEKEKSDMQYESWKFRAFKNFTEMKSEESDLETLLDDIGRKGVDVPDSAENEKNVEIEHCKKSDGYKTY